MEHTVLTSRLGTWAVRLFRSRHQIYQGLRRPAEVASYCPASTARRQVFPVDFFLLLSIHWWMHSSDQVHTYGGWFRGVRSRWTRWLSFRPRVFRLVVSLQVWSSVLRPPRLSGWPLLRQLQRSEHGLALPPCSLRLACTSHLVSPLVLVEISASATVFLRSATWSSPSPGREHPGCLQRRPCSSLLACLACEWPFTLMVSLGMIRPLNSIR